MNSKEDLTPSHISMGTDRGRPCGDAGHHAVRLIVIFVVVRLSLFGRRD